MTTLSPATAAALARLATTGNTARTAAHFALVNRGLAQVVSRSQVLDPAICDGHEMVQVRITDAGRAWLAAH